MLTRNDLATLQEFFRRAHQLGLDKPILDSLTLYEGEFEEILERLNVSPEAPLPLAKVRVDSRLEEEKSGAGKRARIAKLNYDAAREAGMPDPEAFAIAVEAVRQECAKQ